MLNITELDIIFRQYIDKQSFVNGPQNLYEPVNYILNNGGKRVRPLLTLMAAQGFSGDLVSVLPGAFAIELFHNFSLLHDDIMDEAPLRRGKPSVHIKYGLNAGILSGDVMLVKVYEYLSKMPFPDKLFNLLSFFNQAAISVCEGQQLDVDFENMSSVPEKLYIEMIEKKTAALLGAALAIGSIPYTNTSDVDRLVLFGRNLGIAFQLKDDLLDVFGDTQKVGKQKGGDILQNKKTLLTISAQTLGNNKDNEELSFWYSQMNGDNIEKIQQVTEIFIKTGAKEYTEAKIQSYQELAMENLYAIETLVNSQPLVELAEGLLVRES